MADHGDIPTPTPLGAANSGADWTLHAQWQEPNWELHAHWTEYDWELHAQWGKVNRFLMLSACGGIISPAIIKAYVGKPLGWTQGGTVNPLPTPTRDGYTFLGWFTEATMGTVVTEQTIMPDANLTIYAHWQSSSTAVTISFVTYGGTPAPTSITRNVGEAYGALPVVTRAYCNFLGWFTASYYTEPLKATDVVLDNQNHTLYASWEYMGIGGTLGRGIGNATRSNGRRALGATNSPPFVGSAKPVISPSPPAPGLGSLLYDPATGRLIFDD